MHDIQARKHLSIPERAARLSNRMLDDSTLVVRCTCGWQITVRLNDPSDTNAQQRAFAVAEKHSCATAPTIDSPIASVDRAITAICDLNDQFLPAHTREHALEALDLLRVVREELSVPDIDEAPCHLRVVS